jgi:hypothetical protein
MRRGGTLHWMDRELVPRPASRRRERCPLADGDDQLRVGWQPPLDVFHARAQSRDVVNQRRRVGLALRRLRLYAVGFERSCAVLVLEASGALAPGVRPAD